MENTNKVKYRFNSHQIEEIINKGEIIEYDTFNQPVYHKHLFFGKIIFDSIIFESRIDIRIGNTSDLIEFNNCEFVSGITIHSEGSYPAQIKFENCKINSELNLIRRFQKIEFINCPLIKKLSLNDVIIYNQLRLENNQINLLEFKGSIQNETFTIENCSFLDLVELSITSAKSINISNSQFTVLNLQECEVRSLNIYNNTNIERILIVKLNLKETLRIDHAKIEKFQMGAFSEKIAIELYDSFIKVCIVNLNYIKIGRFARLNSSRLYFQNMLDADSYIIIEDTHLSELKFENVVNEGYFELNNVKIYKDEILSILESDFKKMKILNCNFKNCKLYFQDSLISEIFISATDFPKKILFSNDSNSVSNNDYNQGKLFFGQLSTVFQKQGDSVRSYEYLAREVKAYYHTISWLSPMWQTKFNLFLNYLSNNFGRNWLHGLIFSFVVGFLFFYFLILSSQEFVFKLPFTMNWDYVGSFLKFMNPLRHFEAETLFKSENGEKLKITFSNWSYLWDFFGRIFVAYGYYQTIQAFRKFGKK